MGLGMMRIAVSSLILASVLMNCSQGHCRRKKEVGQAVAPVESAPEPATKTAADHGAGRVMVYKYDGSLQCGAAKGLSVEAMAKQLEGIKIISQSKKPDGLMHIQVCGSNTGMSNVYEIPAGDLKKAESKGFKKWSFE
jgi:hypothetical protein